MNQPRPDRRLRLAGGLVLVAALAVPILSAPSRDVLREGFTNPPPEARLRCYWWWLNGNTTEAAITRDLEEMKAKGYGGALLVDANGSEQQGNRAVPAGPMFGSPAWRVLYRHALQEAARLGLEISLNIQSGWNLGGPLVKPEQAAKLLTFSRVAVNGPAEFHQLLAEPPQRNGFYRDVAVLAYPLAHGKPLPGSAGPGAEGSSAPRHPIRQLAMKSATQELGMSMPPTVPLLEDYPPAPGEEDARTRDVADLTARMQPDGSLEWRVPAGTWEILRVGYTSSGARISTSSGALQGLAIDYLDRGALEAYWRENVDPLLADARPYSGALRYLVTDSWELGGLNWTAKFRDEFKQLRGYDVLPYLPVIAGRILDSRETSNRFLNDFRRTIGDLIISRHYAPFAELAARAGLGIHPESGGPHGAPIDALETLGVSAFPQTEFWARSATHRTRDDERFFVKEGSSAAHIYGKTLVAAEGMTSIGPQWEESLWDNLKPTLDQAFCEGLNRLIWHTFTSSPKEMGLPGQEYFAGTHLNPNVTWWNQAGAFLSYVNRSQFLLQQGRPVADVVYFYGEQVPNFARLKGSDPAKVLPGYDYDVTDANALVHRMSVQNGRIVLPDGVSYRLMVLADGAGMSLTTVRAIRKLVADGATVLGSLPQHPMGIEEETGAAPQLPGDLAHMGTRDALAALGVPPDFEYQANGAPRRLDYIHRESAGVDLYFIRNTRPQSVYAEVTLRTRGKAPELWHPDTGKTEPQPVYDFTPDGRTRMPLWLEPNGSVFVVLRQPAGRRVVQLSKEGKQYFPWTAAVTEDPAPVELRLHGDGTADLATQAPGRYAVKTAGGEAFTVEVPAAPEPAAIEGPWTVRFTPGWDAPASVSFNRLESWTENRDPGIRFYSGTATYSARFFLPGSQPQAGRTLYLDLGDVREIAQVRLNGRDLGILWKKPFGIALDQAAKPGWNDLEVAVTNLWPNRLIGDQQLPPDHRLTRTNITKFRADSPLMPSGLLGPVVRRWDRPFGLSLSHSERYP